MADLAVPEKWTAGQKLFPHQVGFPCPAFGHDAAPSDFLLISLETAGVGGWMLRVLDIGGADAPERVRPVHRRMGKDHCCPTTYEPDGVSAQTNPAQMTARPLSAALVTGTVCVINTPELRLFSDAWFAHTAQGTGLPAGAVNILHDPADEAGTALSAHPYPNQVFSPVPFRQASPSQPPRLRTLCRAFANLAANLLQLCMMMRTWTPMRAMFARTCLSMQVRCVLR